MNDIIYFEIDHWCAGSDYPHCEPFISWMSNETSDSPLRDEEWVKKNKICVKIFPIDMSFDFMITAPRSFIEKECPALLKEENQKFIVTDKYGDPNDPEDTPDSRYVGSDEYFLPYTDEYIGKIVYGDTWY